MLPKVATATLNGTTAGGTWRRATTQMARDAWDPAAVAGRRWNTSTAQCGFGYERVLTRVVIRCVVLRRLVAVNVRTNRSPGMRSVPGVAHEVHPTAVTRPFTAVIDRSVTETLVPVLGVAANRLRALIP